MPINQSQINKETANCYQLIRTVAEHIKSHILPCALMILLLLCLLPSLMSTIMPTAVFAANANTTNTRYVPAKVSGKLPAKGKNKQSIPTYSANVYVDMRNGFSLEQPAGMIPVTNSLNDNINSNPNNSSHGNKKDVNNYPGITDWPLIKNPPSQEIIRFVPNSNMQLPQLKQPGRVSANKTQGTSQRQTGHKLIIYLLVTKNTLNIKDMLAARIKYWQQYPRCSQVVQTHISNANSHPIACLFVKWHGQKQNISTTNMVTGNKDKITTPPKSIITTSTDTPQKIARSANKTAANNAKSKTASLVNNGNNDNGNDKSSTHKQDNGNISTNKNKGDVLISEYIFQKEKDRFFMVVNIEPWLEQGTASLPLDTVPAEFNCLTSQQEQNRWEKARQHAQSFLATLKASNINKLLPIRQWYIIKRAGKKVGFSYVTLYTKNHDKKKLFTANTRSYFVDVSEALSFAFMQGLPVGPMVKNPVPGALSGAVWLESSSSLDNNLRRESFDYKLKAAGLTLTLYEQSGSWDKSLLRVKIINDPTHKTQNIPAVKYEVKDNLYLPWSLAQILNRIVRQDNKEYVFMRYSSHGLCYYSLHVSPGLQVEPASQVLSKPHSLSTTPPLTIPHNLAKQHKYQHQNQNQHPQTEKIIATTPKITIATNRPNLSDTHCVLTGQMGIQGAVVQTWLGKDGKIIIKRYNDMTMQPAEPKLIKQLWPVQYKQIEQ